MDKLLKKAMNLAKKTGDRVIVVDIAKSGEAFIIMGINEYEKLVIGYSEVRNLTEDELLDKINRDIAIWKSDNDADDNYKNENKCYGESIGEIIKNKYVLNNDFNNDISDIIDEDMYYYNEEDINFNMINAKENINKKKNKDNWSIPPDVKKEADEIIHI